jgi:hypothetical protein
VANLDNLYVCLELDKDSIPVQYLEPSHYIYETTGRIVSIGDSLRTTLLGKFRIYYVDICAALNDEISVFDVFDTYSETIDYHDAIFEDDSLLFREELLTALKDDAGWGNLLILDRIEILPRFRNKKIGLLVMCALMRRFSAGAALVGIKPFPLQFESVSTNDSVSKWRDKLQLSSMGKQMRSATAKLCRYYRKLGFVPLKGTPFMFRSAEVPLPTVDQLLAKDGK